MSLVDKLEVHVGDLIVLKAKGLKLPLNRTGYVANYTAQTVTLSNTNVRDRKSGEIRNMGFFGQVHKEKVSTFDLESYNAYEVLKKYMAPDTPPEEDGTF